MTPEEAGQRLLEGEPWIECFSCKGTGDGPKTEVATKAGDSLSPGLHLVASTCRVCKGYTTILDPLYAQACDLLDRPYPERVIGFQAEEEIGMAVINLKAISRLGLFTGTVK